MQATTESTARPGERSARPTVRQLEAAVAVADHLHFGRAAEALGISQPALSNLVRTLEEQLQTQLFERSRRSVLTTRAGGEVAGRARRILSQVDELAQSGLVVRAPMTGDLRLGVIPTLGPYLLPRILPGVRERYPELRLFLREEFTDVLVERLIAGEVDALLLALPIPGPFATLSLFRDPFLLALPTGHPLDVEQAVGEAELDDQEVLLLEDGHCLRDQALAVCARSGAHEAGRFRASSLSTLTQMVSGGLGITLLPEVALGVEQRASQDVSVRRFREPEPFREIGLVWRAASERGAEYRALGERIVELVDG